MRKLFSVFKSKLKTAVLYSSCLAENTYNRAAYWVHSCSRPGVARYRADGHGTHRQRPVFTTSLRNPFYAESLPLLTKEGKATPSGWATVHHAEQTQLLRPGIRRSLELAGDLTSTTQSTASELRIPQPSGDSLSAVRDLTAPGTGVKRNQRRRESGHHYG